MQPEFFQRAPGSERDFVTIGRD